MNHKKKTSKKVSKKQKFALPEYYQLTFQSLTDQLSSDISFDPLKIRAELHASFLTTSPTNVNKELIGQEAFEFLVSFSDHTSKKISEIVSVHSVFYWLHLYRRIGVGLWSEDDEKRDPNTIGLVRTIVETATFRFGGLENINDMVLSDQISHQDVLGGYFAKTLSGQLSDSEIKKIWSLYKSQWVISSFTKDDFKNIYHLEIIAYEYWRVIAQMRAVGKGSAIKFDSKGLWYEKRDAKISNLIKSYDLRISSSLSYFPTAKGLISFPTQKSEENLQSILFVRYNTERKRFKDEITGAPKYFHEDLVTNFLPVSVNVKNYLESHRIFEEPFRNKWGFGFEEAILFLQTISFYVFTRRLHAHNNMWISIFQILQRGYIYTDSSTEEFHSELLKIIAQLQNNGINFGKNIHKEFSSIITHFTLNINKQKDISLWSYGPRPIIIPSGKGAFIDLVGNMIVLRNLFFGVKENQTLRGTEFENSLRNETTRLGYELLPNRILRHNASKYRESDLCVRVGDVLVLCDCRSIEKPVDFELGKLKTIENRIKLLQDKLLQINSLREFVMSQPKGSNYDFSWAKTIYSIAVTPEVEWIWTEASEAWINKSMNLPSIMNVEEMFNFFEALK